VNPSLIVTVDTEEEGLWNGQYRREGNTVRNVLCLGRFQELCDRFGVRPTYLVDAPVVEDDAAVELLRGFQDSGRAEIGAHLHPWCNPPHEETLNTRNSYTCNLPEGLQRAKLAWLTERIQERFGRRPTSFRAGRYGLDIVGARILRELGYLIDSSVIPFTDYSADGGPNFDQAPYLPYFVGEENLCTPCESGSLLEAPVSVGFSRLDFARAQAMLQAAQRPWLRRLRVEGILDRLGIARRIKFSPEQSDARAMEQLVDAYLAQKAPAMVMMLHSSSLLPGGSPYAKTDTEREELYRRLSTIFECTREVHRMATATLRQYVAADAGDKAAATTRFVPAISKTLSRYWARDASA
jgi:hypothetical protein